MISGLIKIILVGLIFLAFIFIPDEKMIGGKKELPKSMSKSMTMNEYKNLKQWLNREGDCLYTKGVLCTKISDIPTSN